ncbi:MAG: YfhO family protein [Patescibacteria group bacterium]|nr:YfhO family protein [Patescibacteria group bacterium]
MKFFYTWPRLSLLAFWTVITFAVLFPFLFLGRQFIDADATIYFYPVYDFYHHAVVSRSSFLWNPSIFMGFPVYLSQSAGFLDPLNWLLFHLPTFTAYHLRLAIDFLMVLAASYAASRELKLSRMASLLTGMGYIIAFNWRYLSNIVIADSIFLLPFMFFAGLRFFKAETNLRRLGWVAAMGAAIGWVFICGNAQFTIDTLFLFGIFYLWYFFRILPGKKDLRAMAQWAGLGLLIIAIAFVIGLPEILPALKFTPLTVRSAGVSYDQAIYKSVGLGDLSLFAFPDYLYFPYLSAGRKPLYVGALLFLLAIVGARELLRRRDGPHVSNEARALRALFWLLAFCFIASLQYSPIFYMMQKLPVFGLFRFPYRWMYLGAWFLALIGAYGFDFVRANPISTFTKRLSYVAVACAAALSAVALALNNLPRSFWIFVEDAVQRLMSTLLYSHFGFGKDPTHYRDALARGVEAWQAAVSFADPAFYAPFLILLAAVVLLFFTARGRISAKTFSVVEFALSVITFFAVFALQWSSTLPQSAAKLYDPVVALMPGVTTGQYRTMPFLMTQGLGQYIPPQYTLSVSEVQISDEMLFASGWPNLNQYSGAATVDGYDPFAPVRLLGALTLLGSINGAQDETRGMSQNQLQATLLQNLALLGMMSGKYIVSGVPLASKDLRLVGTSPVSPYQVPLYVYDNDLALPRVYLTPSIVDKPGEPLNQIAAEHPDFIRQTYLDCTSCASYQNNAGDVLKVIEDQNGIMQIATQTAGQRWLVVTDDYLPGWGAAVDGVQAPIVLANGLVMAVEVPAGKHTVALTYAGVANELYWLRLLGVVK